MDKKYELSDLDVQRVGLVGKGAVGEEFFLLKADQELEEVTESVKEEEGFLKRLEGLFTRFFKREPEVVQETTPEVTQVTQTAEVVKEVTMPDEVKKDEVKTEEVKTEVTTAITSTVADATVVVAETKKEDDLAARVALLEQSLKETKEKLATTEKKADEVEKANTELVYLEKAKSFASLPVKPDELAKHFAVLSKSKDTLDYFFALLDAVNKMAGDAGLFSELGTSRVLPKGELGEQAEQIAKEKDIPYRDAILEIPVEKQAELLSKRQIELAHK